MLRPFCLLVLAVLVASCGDDAVSTADVTFVRGSTPGLLTEVNDQQLTLRPDDGSDEQTFAIRQTDRPRLDLFHLEEHVRRKWPVIVFWEDDGGTRYAVQVDDA